MDELRCVVKDLLYVTSSHWDELEPVTAQSIIWILEQLIASDKEQATGVIGFADSCLSSG